MLIAIIVIAVLIPVSAATIYFCSTGTVVITFPVAGSYGSLLINGTAYTAAPTSAPTPPTNFPTRSPTTTRAPTTPGCVSNSPPLLGELLYKGDAVMSKPAPIHYLYYGLWNTANSDFATFDPIFTTFVKDLNNSDYLSMLLPYFVSSHFSLLISLF